MTHLADLIEWMNADLDANVSDAYKAQPLAQDWARIAKLSEEVGEVIDAWIGVTGQNPRKGAYGEMGDVLDELMDVALTALYAAQHFIEDAEQVVDILTLRAEYHRQRREAQLKATA